MSGAADTRDIPQDGMGWDLAAFLLREQQFVSFPELGCRPTASVLRGMWLLPCTPLLATSQLILHPQLPSLLLSPHSPARGSPCRGSPSPLPADARGNASGSRVPRDPVAAPGCAPSPASPRSRRCGLRGSAGQAGWSKWSVRSSNRACFRSGARRLSPELSFCSRCPWLFPSPSAFGFPLAREEEKSSERRGVTKWMLLSSSSSACLPGMLVSRGMLWGADHILGFNDVF